MSKSDATQLASISKACTIEEIAEFWDTHSLADYWDQTYEVQFEVEARARGILPETLVNLWLVERLRGEVA